MITGLPWACSGTNGIGGASATLAMVESSSGAASAASRKPLIVSGVPGRIIMPPTISEISCSLNRKRVAMPKFDSPPRIAQKRSGSESSLASTTWPSAVTTSAASRSSIVSPFLRTRKPIPPARVIPPIPTEPVSPKPVTRPRSAVAFVYWPAVAPVSTQALSPSGVDLDRVHAGEVDDEAALAGPVSGAVVAAAPHGEVEPGLARRGDDPRDVRGARHPRDRQRPPVDSLEEDVARLVIGGIVRGDQLAVELGAKFIGGDVLCLFGN